VRGDSTRFLSLPRGPVSFPPGLWSSPLSPRSDSVRSRLIRPLLPPPGADPALASSPPTDRPANRPGPGALPGGILWPCV
jgi:hypothetical protein